MPTPVLKFPHSPDHPPLPATAHQVLGPPRAPLSCTPAARQGGGEPQAGAWAGQTGNRPRAEMPSACDWLRTQWVGLGPERLHLPRPLCKLVQPLPRPPSPRAWDPARSPARLPRGAGAQDPSTCRDGTLSPLPHSLRTPRPPVPAGGWSPARSAWTGRTPSLSKATLERHLGLQGMRATVCGHEHFPLHSTSHRLRVPSRRPRGRAESMSKCDPGENAARPRQGADGPARGRPTQGGWFPMPMLMPRS